MREILAVIMMLCGCHMSDQPSVLDASIDGTSGACAGCAADEGCVKVAVVRIEDTSMQPWEWPGIIDVDGLGTLIVSAVMIADEGQPKVLSRETVADADMLPSDARYVVDLGCVPAGQPLNLIAFLDIDTDASDEDWHSGSFGDACMNNPRWLVCTVEPGEMITAELALSSQCYHRFDIPAASTCRL